MADPSRTAPTADARHDLWLVRHGETEWARLGRHTGRTDVPLTETGRDQARDLGRRLAGHAFELVLTSPLSRAADTAVAGGLRRRRAAGPRPARMGLRRAGGAADRGHPRRVPGLDDLARPVAGRRDDRRGRGPRGSRHGRGPRGRPATSSSLRTDTSCASSPPAGSDLRRRPAGCSRSGTATVSVLGWEREAPVVETWNEACRDLATDVGRDDVRVAVPDAPRILVVDDGPCRPKVTRGSAGRTPRLPRGRHGPVICAPTVNRPGDRPRVTMDRSHEEARHDQRHHGSDRAAARRRRRLGRGCPSCSSTRSAAASSTGPTSSRTCDPTRRAVAFDLRGHGRSVARSVPTTRSRIWPATSGRSSTGSDLDRVVLVGHSIGGATADRLCRAAPGARRRDAPRRDAGPGARSSRPTRSCRR